MTDSPVFPDNYTEITKVGEGGMGFVYKAFDRSMDRIVALKVLRKSSFTPEQLKRFQAEAKSLSRLDHPNIIKAFQFTILPDGNPCMVMEYVEGQGLDTIIESGPLSLGRAVPIFLQIAAALSFAHEQGIVHRDIKPSNVCINQDEQGNEIGKLLDFGIARDLTGEEQKLTATGAILGSLAYASPEQLSSSKVDHRSDIYSLGVLMHEVLTGELPPRLPSDPSPRIKLPEGIDRILQLCLAERPDHRFQTAKQLEQALRKGDATAAKSPPQAVPSTVRLAIVGIAVAALIAAAVAWQAHVSAPAAKTEVADVRTDHGDKVAMEAASAEADQLMKQHKYVTAEAILQEAIDRYAQQPSDRTKETALRLYHQLGRLQAKQDKLNEAEKNLINAISLISPTDKEKKAEYSIDLGKCYARGNDNKAAIGVFKIAENSAPKGSTYQREAKHLLGEMLYHKERFDEAQKKLNEAIELCGEGDSDAKAGEYYLLGHVFAHSRKYGRAVQNFKTAQEMYLRLGDAARADFCKIAIEKTIKRSREKT